MNRLLLSILTLGAIGTAGYALFAYTALPLGSVVHPEMNSNFNMHRNGIYTHIFSSLVALALGPAQFMTRLRTNLPRVHRVCGFIYFACVYSGGISGFYMAQFSYGGSLSHVGFALLAVLWITTATIALVAVKQRNFVQHERWAIRCFSLTLAAVSLRIALGVGFASSLPFDEFYPWLAWVCWLPNLALAEIFIRVRGTGHPSPVTL